MVMDATWHNQAMAGIIELNPDILNAKDHFSDWYYGFEPTVKLFF